MFLEGSQATIFLHSGKISKNAILPLPTPAPKSRNYLGLKVGILYLISVNILQATP